MRAALLLVVGPFALLGCATGGPAAPPSPEAAPTAVQRIGLTEWDVVTERRPLLPGQVELSVTNAGAAPHDLVVDADGERIGATRVLGSGEQASLRLTVPSDARLTLWCSVPGHLEAGMHVDVRVAATPRAGTRAEG